MCDDDNAHRMDINLFSLMYNVMTGRCKCLLTSESALKSSSWLDWDNQKNPMMENGCLRDSQKVPPSHASGFESETTWPQQSAGRKCKELTHTLQHLML